MYDTLSIKDQCKYVNGRYIVCEIMVSTETAMCGNCVNSVEDACLSFFQMPTYDSCRMILFQVIKNIIISSDHQLLLELVVYGSPYHGLHIKVQIFKVVCILLLQQQNTFCNYL